MSPHEREILNIVYGNREQNEVTNPGGTLFGHNFWGEVIPNNLKWLVNLFLKISQQENKTTPLNNLSQQSHTFS